jgi:oxygen-independent coproporphyrinogen-3 oxidase
MGRSLYIHIPFCRRKCIYCDFCSVIYNEAVASDYVDTLARQVNDLDGVFNTVYIGGGTPTTLTAGMLDRLFRSLKGRLDKGYEFTIEANPESLDATKIKTLRDGGCNRLSIGAQSFNDKKLKRLGRIHDSAMARDSVGLAARCGFDNVSIDLIFGVWDEDMRTWQKDLEEAAALPVKHMSCYSLTYEKDTPLFEAARQKSIIPLEDDTMGRMYGMAIEDLSVRGFKQYEISSFAREGYECRHNLNYWENNPYTGLGASAVSYLEGTRTTNIADIGEYIKRADEASPVAAHIERLPPVKRAKETAAVKVRTKEGIDFAWFKDRTGYDLQVLEKKALPKLAGDGLIKYKRTGNAVTGIQLRRKGFLFCDLVSSELL